MRVLEYDNVRKSFGDNEAVRGVSMHVDKGEVFGLLGPNGAGKTTLIRCALDIIRPNSGEVKLFGEPLRRDMLQRLSYLPEERGLYKKTKVLESLMYFGRIRGMSNSEAKKKAMRWLARVGMADEAQSPVPSLSKGMSQKVQIASTLMSEPELVILDEPFSGLDPVNTQLIKEIIDERRATGQTTVLSTHMMNQVQALCDRVGLINRGQLMVYGSLSEVRRNYSQPMVRVEISSEELPAGLPHVLKAEPDDKGILVTLDAHDAEAFLPALVSQTVVHRYEPVLASMQDIFVDVVTKDATSVPQESTVG